MVRPRLRLSVFAFFVASGVLLAVAAILILSLTGTKISDSIVATAAVVALVGAFGSIQGARTIARQQLTYDYVARFNDPDLLAHRGRLSSYWNLAAPPPVLDNRRWNEFTEGQRAEIRRAWKERSEPDRQQAKCQQWEAMEPEERTDLLVFMNFMEELSGAFNLGLLDARSVKKHIASGAKKRYEQGEWWIGWIRDLQHNDRLLRDWEHMNETLLGVSEDKSAAAAWLGHVWQSVARAWR